MLHKMPQRFDKNLMWWQEPVYRRLQLMVVARDHNDGMYYKGFVRGDDAAKALRSVCFIHTEPQTIPRDKVIAFGGSVPWPHLFVKDYVLAAIYLEDIDAECYFPGRILYMPKTHSFEASKFFCVRLHNGELVDKVRRELIKISSCVYKKIILEMEPRPKPRPEEKPPVRPTTPPTVPILVPVAPVMPESKKKEAQTDTILDSHHTQTDPMKDDKTVQCSLRTPRVPTPQHEDPLPPPPLVEEEKPTRDPPTRNRLVLARWPDDGWYYIGQIVDEDKALNRFWVQDHIGNICEMKGDDILREENKVQADVLEKHFTLKKDDHLLQCWRGDYWLYYGKVIDLVKKGKDHFAYEIETDEGTIVEHPKHERLCGNLYSIHPFDYRYVIAMHPNHVYSYAPAKIRRVFKQNLTVRCADLEFFDGILRTLPCSDLFKITEKKYNKVVDKIVHCEYMLHGTVAVVLNPDSGMFELARVEEAVLRQRFKVAPLSGPPFELKGIHVFSTSQKSARKRDTVWTFALVPVGKKCYLPAELRHESGIDYTAHCVDGLCRKVETKDCYYLSEIYYAYVCKVYEQHNSEME